MTNKSCICGYEYEEKWVKKPNGCGYDTIVLKGEKDFIEIEGTFLRKNENRWGDQTSRVSVYSCPICGTLKIFL